MSLKQEEFYKPEDLQIGSHINIHGREVLISGCNDFTRAWIKDK